jgi:N-acyl homoserine lactone hydrolase
MAAAAEPQPAELPIPGGREGATVKLHPLLTGTLAGPEAWFLRQPGRRAALRAFGIGTPKDQWLRLPVPAFLLEHPSAGPVLIDTGFHSSVAVDPKQNLGRLGTLTFKNIEMDAAQAVPEQLRARDIEPSTVETVLMTHLHIDHASGMSEFPGATFLFSKREWEAATSDGQFHGYYRRQFDHAFEYRTLDFDVPDCDSFATFGRAYDIFGDGSVRAVYTPGHTHGHMSFVLRLADREALVAADAIYMMRTLTDSHLPYRMADEHEFRRSLREIQIYAEQTPDALIIPGHDMAAWEKLQPSY